MQKICLFSLIMIITTIFACSKRTNDDIKMQTMDREQEEKIIRAVEEAYDDAWNNNNIDAVMECLAEDVVAINPFGKSATGKIEFQKMLVEYLNGPGKNTKHKSIISHVNLIAENVAVVDGQAVILNKSKTDNLNDSSFSHYFTDVLVKRDNRWLIAQIRAYSYITRDTNNPD